MASRRGGGTFLTAGLPFVTFIVGGSYMLSEFVSGQVHVKDVRKRSKSLREFDIEEVRALLRASSRPARERERERERERDREGDRDRDRQTDRQTDREIERRRQRGRLNWLDQRQLLQLRR